MAFSMKKILQNLLYRKNRYIFRTTDPKTLQEFFAMVKPQSTNHKLIRVGGNSDGGYLVPDDLAGIKNCFSPGVSVTANFENELAERGIKSYLADYSVEKAPIENEFFDFEKKYLGAKTDDIFMTLDGWVHRKCPNDSDMILQMDIEGAEYPVIFDSSAELLQKFRILVIEFHGLDALIQKAGFDLINLTFTKLLNHFEIVHIHPNNCLKSKFYKGFEIPPVMEMTFLRKDRISQKTPAKQFPHPLDVTNAPGKDDIALPECWYNS